MFLDFAVVDIPKEVVAKYGDMTNWRNSVGTGPFMLTDLVPGSLVTLPKNPRYFMKDPAGPGKGNQLPYVDGVRILVIPDTSTRLAAFRTGKLDMSLVDWADVSQVLKTMPQLSSRKGNSTTETTIAMRQDKKDKPFSDIRVRRALTMAIDYDTLVTTMTGGTAPKLGFPGKDPQFPETWVSFEEAPASVQELFTYNPEKAKQLLKEAGYPNGFKTTVLLPSTSAAIDNLSILKGYWAKVGVDLALDARQQAVFDSLRNTRTYDDMINYGGAGGIRGTRFRGDGLVNQSYVNDPVVNEASDKVNATFLVDPAGAMKTYKDLLKYAYDQAWTISFPVGGPSYTFWWPWLKNFYGDTTIGYFNAPNGFQFAWVDQELKKSMGY
jgi:peptide/nickel transport system substrate-binding protein